MTRELIDRDEARGIAGTCASLVEQGEPSDQPARRAMPLQRLRIAGERAARGRPRAVPLARMPPPHPHRRCVRGCGPPPAPGQPTPRRPLPQPRRPDATRGGRRHGPAGPPRARGARPVAASAARRRRSPAGPAGAGTPPCRPVGSPARRLPRSPVRPGPSGLWRRLAPASADRRCRWPRRAPAPAAQVGPARSRAAGTRARSWREAGPGRLQGQKLDHARPVRVRSAQAGCRPSPRTACWPPRASARPPALPPRRGSDLQSAAPAGPSRQAATAPPRVLRSAQLSDLPPNGGMRTAGPRRSTRRPSGRRRREPRLGALASAPRRAGSTWRRRQRTGLLAWAAAARALLPGPPPGAPGCRSSPRARAGVTRQSPPNGMLASDSHSTCPQDMHAFALALGIAEKSGLAHSLAQLGKASTPLARRGRPRAACRPSARSLRRPTSICPSVGGDPVRSLPGPSRHTRGLPGSEPRVAILTLARRTSDPRGGRHGNHRSRSRHIDSDKLMSSCSVPSTKSAPR